MAKNALLSAVDFRYLLLDCYKKMGLAENEVVVILMVDHLLEQGNSIVTNDMLALKMNYAPKDVDKIMVGLFKRGYVSYDTVGKSMKTSLEPLKNKLYSEFQRNLEKEHQSLLSEQRETALTELNAFFENRLARPLSPLESQTLGDWLEAGYSNQEIKDALLDALAQGKKNVRAVDKILRETRTDKDIAKEGVSAVSPSWDKDIEETMKIAKEMWGTPDKK